MKGKKKKPHRDACEKCGFIVRIGDFPLCQGKPEHHMKERGHGKSSPFKTFMFDADNGEVVEINSLHKLREVETRSMKRAEQGLGRPFNFRVYSQDRSNLDEGVFGRVPADIKDFSIKDVKRKGRISGGFAGFGPGESLED